MLLPVLLALAPAELPSRPIICHIEAARYVLRADPTVTARFHIVPRTEDWRWGVALEIRLGATGRTSWWLPFLGGTSDVHGLRWTARRGTPEAMPGYRYNLLDLQYFAFEDDYDMINTTPMRGDYAPQHMLLNDLREAFWYRDDPDHRYSPPRSLFDLTGCADEAAEGIQSETDVLFPRVP
ncbi:MAG: hypothetical protein ACJ8ER_06995 [Allosphingosinicella sp.]